MISTFTRRAILSSIWAALDGDLALPDVVTFTGEGSLKSAFAVSDLAAGSVAAAALAIADYAGPWPFDPAVVQRKMAVACSHWWAASQVRSD